MPGHLASEGQDSWHQGDEKSAELCAQRDDSQNWKTQFSSSCTWGNEGDGGIKAQPTASG